QLESDFAFLVAHFIEHRLVISRVDDHGHRLIILRGTAQHRRPADIDLLDRFRKFDSGLGDRRLEWIEIHDHEIDRLDPMLTRGRFVLFVSAQVKEAAVHFRVKRLHPAVEDFREAGEVRDLDRLDFFVAQKFERAAGGNDLDALFLELARELDYAGLVGNGEEGALDFHEDLRRTRIDATTYITSPKARDKPNDKA